MPLGMKQTNGLSIPNGMEKYYYLCLLPSSNLYEIHHPYDSFPAEYRSFYASVNLSEINATRDEVRDN